MTDQLNRAYLIIQGWKNLFFKDDTIEKMARNRAEICGKCSYSIFVTGDLYNHCKKCKCYLPAKVRSKDSKCPIEKW